MNRNKFNFYDIVKISNKNPELQQISGGEGVITGMAQSEETGSWGYSVSIYSDGGLCWRIMEDDLIETGKKAKQEDFYTGESIKVRVNPETGEGELVEDN